MTRHPGWVLLDALVVVALTCLALTGLEGTFAGWGFLTVGAVAAGASVVLVLLCAALPAVATWLVVPVGAVLLGGAVALRSGGLLMGVPDGQTLREVLVGSFFGWGELLTTLPHVDLAGPPALVPYLLGFLGAGAAAALALRGRSAAGPLLPLLAVVLVVLLLARTDRPPVGGYLLAFAALAVVWVVLRGLQLTAAAEPAAVGRRRGTAVRGAVAVLVCALALLLAAGLTSAGSNTSDRTLRGRVGSVPSTDDLDSPLRRFRTFTEQDAGAIDNVHRRVLFTVTGAPEGSRLRLVTLDTYDGQQWLPGNDTMSGTTQDRFLRMDTRVDAGASGTPVRATVEVGQAYAGAWVPTIGSLTSLDFLYTDLDHERDNLRYDVATSTALLAQGLGPGDDYRFTAVQGPSRLRRTMRPWPAPVLSVAGTQRVDPLLKDLPGRADPMGTVFAVARYLRTSGRYSDGAGPGQTQYRPGHDLGRLVGRFLLAPRPVGDDEQYAAAMALVANRVGVPARVVVGAVVPDDGKVRGRDVHAWVELRVADGTWRTLPTSQFMGTRPPQRGMPPAVPPRLAPSTRPAQAPPTRAEQRQVRQQERRDVAQRRSWVIRALPWLLPLVLLLLVSLAKPARRAWRRRRGRPSDRMAGAWTELVDAARDLGVPVRPGTTRPQQADRLRRAVAHDPGPDTGGGAGDWSVAELADLVDAGVFAREEPTETQVGQAWQASGDARRHLDRSQGLRRRAWAPFNPVTLVRRPGQSGSRPPDRRPPD